MEGILWQPSRHLVSGLMSGRGRPSLYTEEIADRICELMTTGESVLAISKMDGMPSEAAIRRWYTDDFQGFAAKYARARDIQADAVAERAIADAKAAKDPGLGRLVYDAMKWHASKLAPKKYGERLEIDANVRASVVTAEPLSEDEWQAQHTKAKE